MRSAGSQERQDSASDDDRGRSVGEGSFTTSRATRNGLRCRIERETPTMPVPRRNLDLTHRQLTEWLRHKLADARDLAITDLRGPSDTGVSSDTLMFEAQWSDGTGAHSERLVARFKPSGFTVFPRYDMARQFRIMH